jgi:hypothetical protein
MRWYQPLRLGFTSAWFIFLGFFYWDAAFAEEQVVFSTPSGNIECVYTPKGGTATYQPVHGGPELVCDRIEPHYRRVILGPTGPAVLITNVGDASASGNLNPVPYGANWSRGPFACSSTTAGLSCVRAGKKPHGFSLSRSDIKTY